MRKPIGLLGALTILVSLAGVVATPGVSGAQNPGMGSVKCTGTTGTGTFSPALTAAGSPGGDKFTWKVVSKACTGSVTLPSGLPVHVSGAKLKVQGFWNPTNDCAGLTTDTLGTVTWTYTWSSTPAIAPTVVTSNGGMPWIVSGTHFKFVFPAGSPPPPLPTDTPASSFYPLTSMTAAFKTNILSACSTGWGPYPTATITSGNFSVVG